MHLATATGLAWLLLSNERIAAEQPIEGWVEDATGASVPGAIVRVSCEGRTEAQTRTDSEGRFQLPHPGRRGCELEITHEHFRPVSLAVSRPSAALRIRLEIAPVRLEMTVRGQAAELDTDPSANQNRIALDRDLLASLPALDRDPVAAAARYLDPALAGGATLVVDGLETRRLGVTPSAIQEVRINRNPYSAEFGTPGPGRIEVTTNQGSSDLRGSLTFVFRDHRLNARNAFAAERPPEQRRIVEGHVTGPLTRDGKTAFLVSGERAEQDEWSTVFARTAEGLVNQPAAHPERESEFSFTVRRELAGGGAMGIHYDVDRETAEGGVGGFALPEAGYRDTEREQGLRFAWRAVAGANALHEFNARWESEERARRSRLAGAPKRVVLDAFTAGGAQDDYSEEQQRLELGYVLSALGGRHSIRTGLQFPDLARWKAEDRRLREGVFVFSSLEEFRRGRALYFQRREGDGRARFWTATVVGFVQDDLRVGRDVAVAAGLRWEAHHQPGRYLNLGPRLAVAWAPRRRLVLRAGSGLYFARVPAGLVRDSRLLDASRIREILMLETAYPEPAGIAERLAGNRLRLERGLRPPRLLHSSAGLEAELKPKTALTLHYSGVRGWGLLRSRDLNAPLPPSWARPDPETGVLQQIEGSAALQSHTLEAGLRGEPVPWFTGAVTYQCGGAEDDTDGPESFPADSGDLRGEWGPASFDRRHRFRAYGRFRAGRWFQLGLIAEAESGRPYTLTTGRDDNRDGRALDRPPGARRNGLRGPGRVTLDVRWSREFSLRRTKGAEEPPSIELVVDAFNVMNQVNPTRVVGNLSSPFFGRPVAAEASRRLQLSLEIKF
ncbi:MAG: hypothetical protein RMK57_10575 [Bryobacterales bacterium]|nr:hypothetical protein [Bryobacterales bacterium]